MIIGAVGQEERMHENLPCKNWIDGLVLIEVARFGNVTERDLPLPRSSVIGKKVCNPEEHLLCLKSTSCLLTQIKSRQLGMISSFPSSYDFKSSVIHLIQLRNLLHVYKRVSHAAHKTQTRHKGRKVVLPTTHTSHQIKINPSRATTATDPASLHH
jgi:hypothetical protein